MFLLYIFRIAAYLLNFLFLRHCRIIWAGLVTTAKVWAYAFNYLLENEDHLFPLVRALIFAAKYVILILYQCICDGVRACNICNGIRLTVFIGNPAFGGRGAGVRRRSRRRKGRNFDATLGFPGEGWARLRFGTWNCRGLKVGSVISRDLSVFTPVGVSLRVLVQRGRTMHLCKAKIMYYMNI